ncbi:MAG: DUF86 domain-containing protein [Chloroflexota bacterium]
MNPTDQVRLRHMLDAAHAALAFTETRTRQTLEDDLMFAFALVRAIEIVGEAASRISKEEQENYPQIPWKSITGMRNKIIHDYFDIDYDVVWETVQRRIPELIIELEKILPET